MNDDHRGDSALAAACAQREGRPGATTAHLRLGSM
jgi:hypothetical protein